MMQEDPTKRLSDSLVKRALQFFRKDYLTVARYNIKAWQAWLAICLVAGLIGGILLVLNRTGDTGEFEAGRAESEPHAVSREEVPSIFGTPVSNGVNPFLGAAPVREGCDRYVTPETQDACQQAQAIRDHNPSLCESITTASVFVSRDACLNLLARETHNPSLCGRITSPVIKENCTRTVK
ncbi:MAG: hypothetical protein Q8R40_04705 [bacterium]|nr:hypothetical protein [bacterium]